MKPQFPRLVLASKSPRRQQLLKEAGFDFEIRTQDADESFPEEMAASEVPVFLSRKKSEAFELGPGEVLVTADTIVVLGRRIINKPADEAEAIAMLSDLSGTTHEVYTGVTIRRGAEVHSFAERTLVHFRELMPEEIQAYVTDHKPLDKAGAYGIQEWIGYIGVTGIEGCYYNVMGFPLSRFYSELKDFISRDR